MVPEFRCNCPITSALDILGDKWILVIVKQMLLEGKETFKDFTDSDEAIATNILTSKLKYLEEMGLVTKSKLPTNKKTVYYHLTNTGLSLTPIIVELALWSDHNLRDLHPQMLNSDELNEIKTNREVFVETLKANYVKKRAAILEK